MPAKRKVVFDFVVVGEFLRRWGGEHALGLTKICEAKRTSRRGCTDEDIGRGMNGLKITEIRAILNRLHYLGIACYQKTRNNNTGWYSYTWGINKKRIAELVLEEHANAIGGLEDRINYETTHVFFGCNNSTCDRLPFEIVAEYNFKCPGCGAGMNVVDNKKTIRELKNRLKIVKDEIKEIEGFV